jgi:hypothetical protein
MTSKMLAAAAAAMMIVGPAGATPSVTQVQPAVEHVDGDSALFDGSPGSFVGPVLFATIVALGILLATDSWPFDEDDDEDLPVSP